VSIDGFTEKKLELLQCFQSQANVRKYLEPDFVLSTARYWSRFSSGNDHCEPLEIIRDAADLSINTRARTGIRNPGMRNSGTGRPE
jgi:hypothetical protein